MRAIVALAILTASAGADSRRIEYAVYAGMEGRWPACMTGVDTADAPPSTHVGKLDKAIGKLADGSDPTLKELRAECLAQAKASPDRVREWTSVLQADVYVLFVHANPDYSERDYDKAEADAARCTASCDRAAEVLGAGTKVTLDGSERPTWTGTIAAAKTDICAPARKAADALRDKRLAPYTSAGIKNDKLKLLDADHVAHPVGTPGGTFTLDPAALAKANVWFTVERAPDCPDDRAGKHLHRFEFDGDGKLVKQTVSDQCEPIPASAYK